MKLFRTIGDLIPSLDLDGLVAGECDSGASWLFARLVDWDNAPLTAELMVLDDEDEEQGYNPEDEDRPIQAVERDMQGLLEYATFEAILAEQYRQNSMSTINDYVTAIDHYREYDSFFINTISAMTALL